MLKRDSIVILDGMNYIKGWRYQLWCEAKAAQTTCCVVCIGNLSIALRHWLTISQVHVGTPVDRCVAINDARLRRQGTDSQEQSASDSQTLETSETPAPGDSSQSVPDNEEPYPADLLNNLIFRYEEPSTHSRWDKPLFTVPWDDPQPPVADIFQALTGVVLPSSETEITAPIPSLTDSLANVTIFDTASIATGARTVGGSRGGLSTRPRIVPHQATVQAVATDSNAMYAMEKKTSAVVTAIRTFTLATPSAEVALAQSAKADGISIEVPGSLVPVFIPAHVAMSGTTDELAGAGGILALPKLQRLRRQWISLNRAYIGRGHGAGGPGALTADQVGDAFVRFLNAEFGGGVTADDD